MSYTSNFNLNQRVSYLESIIQGLIPVLPINLANVLLQGNSAGASDIDLNNQDILQVNNIDLTTINGSAYPPPSTPSSTVFPFKARTNSQAPPLTNGQIEWDNVVQQNATQIFVSHQDSNGDDIQVLLNALPVGTIFIIQDQSLGSLYQKWTITSVSQVINQYITFGVTLLASTTSFSNNDDILFISISANQNLEQVLAVGNSAGVYSINMNTQPITNISTATAKTSLVVDNAVTGANSTLTQSNLTINATGLSGLPSLTLNQSGVGTGLLTEEFYNQRTAQTGEFNRMSFYAKSSTGVKTEYARIKTDAPVVISGSVRGRLDLAVQQGSGLVDYLTLNGQVGSVGLGATLDCNSNAITEIGSATTSNGFQIGSQSVNFLTGNSATPAGTKDNNLRAVYINTGVPDSLEAVTGTFPSTWGNILCSAYWTSNFGNNLWVGTDTGKLYWTADNGASWNYPNPADYVFDGAIRCMVVFNNNLWFGGEFVNETFTGSNLNYIAYLDNNEIIQSAFWTSLASKGVNNFVNTMVVEVSSGSYLYFGGVFTADIGNTLGVLNLAIVDTGLILFDTDGQTTGLNGNGFTGGSITQIEINASYPDSMAVCGDFSDFTSSIYGTISCPNFCIWRFSGPSSNAGGLYPILNGGITLNAISLSVMRNGNSFYIGGNFTNTLDNTLTASPYFFSIEYDGATWNQTANPYTFLATNPITKQLHPNAGGLWWADSSGALYLNNVFLTNAPFGAWSWIGSNDYAGYFSTNSSSQNPITMYYWKTSDTINIALNNPLVNPSGNTYTGNLILGVNGSTAELVWSGSAWYVLSTQGTIGYN